MTDEIVKCDESGMQPMTNDAIEFTDIEPTPVAEVSQCANVGCLWRRDGRCTATGIAGCYGYEEPEPLTMGEYMDGPE